MAGVADEAAAEISAQSPMDVARPARSDFTIRPSHVRTLLWLRWKLTLRGYTRSVRRIISLVLLMLIMLPFVGFLAFGTTKGYDALPRAAAAQLLFGVVGLLYLIWAALPLLQYTLNEGLDVTKLQTFPLTRGEQMVSLVLSTLMDISTLFLVALYAAVIAGWHATPLATAVTLVALAVAYVHTVGLSQLVLAALMGLLRSRRFRDVSVIVFALMGSACSLASQVISRALSYRDPSELASIHIDRYLQWTPPGMAIRAVVLADQGEYVQALPWLVGALALVPVLLTVWARVLEHGITTAETSGSGSRGRARRRGRLAVASAAGPSVPSQTSAQLSIAGTPSRAIPAVPVQTAEERRWRPLSGAALAIARKDALYLWRDPQLKAVLLSTLLAGAFILVPQLYTGRRAASSVGLGENGVLLAAVPTLFFVLSFSLNALGMERQGLQTLFLYPIRPLDVFWGKNLVMGGIAMALQLVFAVVLAVTNGGWINVPVALGIGLAAVLVEMGCGNVTSVLVPFRMRQMRMGDTGSMSSESGFLRGIVSLITMMVTALLLTPVAAAVVIPLVIGHRVLLFATIPAAVLYAAVFHQITTRLIAPRMLTRAPEILAATTREA